MMLRKISRFMELFWLALAIGTGLSAIYIIAVDGWDQGNRWIWFPLICLAMYAFRRITRGRLEAMDDRFQQRGK
jgi:hypothetical protein